MKTIIYPILAAAALAAVLIGCSTPTPYLDKNWGKSQTQAVFAQTLNPEPANAEALVEGLDGDTSAIVEDKYQESFKTKAPRPVYNINMPGVTSQ